MELRDPDLETGAKRFLEVCLEAERAKSPSISSLAVAGRTLEAVGTFEAALVEGTEEGLEAVEVLLEEGSIEVGRGGVMEGRNGCRNS